MTRHGKRSGNRVKTAPVQGMTAADTLRSQPATLYHPVLVNRLVAIVGTGGHKTTGGRRIRRNSHLIESYED